MTSEEVVLEHLAEHASVVEAVAADLVEPITLLASRVLETVRAGDSGRTLSRRGTTRSSHSAESLGDVLALLPCSCLRRFICCSC